MTNNAIWVAHFPKEIEKEIFEIERDPLAFYEV